MANGERYTYLQIQYERCGQASKPEKSGLLDKMVEVMGLTLSHLIELLRSNLTRRAQQKQCNDT